MRPTPSTSPAMHSPQIRAVRPMPSAQSQPATSPLVSRSTIRLSSPKGRLNEAGAGKLRAGRLPHRALELFGRCDRGQRLLCVGEAAVHGKAHRHGAALMAAVQPQPDLPPAAERDRLGRAIDALSHAFEPVHDAVVTARPGEDVEPVRVVGRVRRVEADGGERLAVRARLHVGELDLGAGVGHLPARARRRRPRSGERKRRGRRSARRAAGEIAAHRGGEQRAQQAARDARDRRVDQALGEQRVGPGQRHRDLRPAVLGREADRPAEKPGEGAEGERPRGAGRAEREQLDTDGAGRAAAASTALTPPQERGR